MPKTVDQIQAEIFMALVNKRLKNRIKAMIPEIKNSYNILKVFGNFTKAQQK
jgi:hypothetical protein